MRILIPVDGSAHSSAAVAFVASRGTLIGAQPAVELRNVQLPIPPRAARVVGRAMVASVRKAEAQAVLRPALATLKKAGLEAQARHEAGSPGAAVARAASAADLVVMGSHRQGLLKSAVLGSVATRVAACCRTPLLLIRQAGRR
jgi:nucleotide-binding universal stress UspA family protein